MWSAEAILAKMQNPNIEIIIPKEGYAISIDNFAIVKGSKNLEAVYLFIDYILSTEVMEKIVLDYPYFSVNKETNKRISINNSLGSDYLKMQNTVIDGQRVDNIGDSIVLYDKLWAAIK